MSRCLNLFHMTEDGNTNRTPCYDGRRARANHNIFFSKVEAQLTLLRQRQNQLSCANKTKEAALGRAEDELRDMQRSSAKPAKEANPMMRQIRTLENRLDKAMIKYNEAQSIRKTYDQIVKRLKEERVNFGESLCSATRADQRRGRSFD